MPKITQKTRIIIYIAIAVAVIVIGAMAVLSQRSGGESLLGEKLELGQQYLVELSYDKAVLEFTDAINIEPKSADAYIGLAEAYKGLGDTEKARETLEKGYDLTGDERIKALLEELDKAEVVTAETTTAETTAATETITAETTVAETVSTEITTTTETTEETTTVDTEISESEITSTETTADKQTISDNASETTSSVSDSSESEEYETIYIPSKRIVTYSSTVTEDKYTYDSYGRLIKTVGQYIEGDIFTYEYKYNDQNNIVEKKYMEEGTQYESITTYTYDNYGRCIKSEEKDAYDRLFIKSYKYDENNNIIEYNWNYDDGEEAGTYFCQYDKNNNRLSKTQHFETVDDVFTYVYDENNDIIKKLRNGELRYSYKYTYDKNNNLTEKITYDSIVDPCEITTENYKYDKNNNLIWYKTSDGYTVEFEYISMKVPKHIIDSIREREKEEEKLNSFDGI